MNKANKLFDCCKVAALVSVDERGQMVLPKEIRNDFGIKTGDKLAIITFSGGQKNCCLVLMKAEDLEETIKEILNPIIGKVIKK